MKSRLKIDIIKKNHVGFSTDVLVSLAQNVIKTLKPDLLKIDNLAVSVVFVDDQEIQKINKNQRGEDRPTDVLSFSYLAELGPQPIKDKPVILGEIIISTETLAMQADQSNHSKEDELRVLFVHGLLHVLGYAHGNKRGFKEMLTAEQGLLGDKSGLLKRAEPE